MNQDALKSELGKIDIYLLDQIMKNRYSDSNLILDAGCGHGRNLATMLNLGFNMFGCDKDDFVIDELKLKFPQTNLISSDLKNLPYKDKTFDHIICNAVLHFAKTEIDFKQMLNELYRVLKIDGSLFIRMTSAFGMENLIKPYNEMFLLPDGSYRFLLTTEMIDFIEAQFNYIEPLKTVNVNNLRCMSTLVLIKK
jgi:SAM-dependent methyltransferase